MGLDVGQKNQIFYFGRDRRWNEILYFNDVVNRQISDNSFSLYLLKTKIKEICFMMQYFQRNCVSRCDFCVSQITRNVKCAFSILLGS